MSIIALAIMLDSPGSPIFVQERIGKFRERFRMFKFRTMRRDYDDENDRAFMQAYITGEEVENDKGEKFTVYKPNNRKYHTLLGRMLRKTSLDELPQVINIIKGEMSLIGPRPNVPWEVDEYLDWHYKRLDVLPGITGLAQVRGRSCLTFNDIVYYDIDYINNVSFKLDMHILWMTIMLVFRGVGAG
jgi:lipopolysaccharide/colanic/teichoic acid biosynthesis glycosyltransferase